MHTERGQNVNSLTLRLIKVHSCEHAACFWPCLSSARQISTPIIIIIITIIITIKEQCPW